MRITIAAFGSRGDVQPLVALGAGLQAAGYAVRFATDATFQPLIEAQQLEYAPLSGDIRTMLGGEHQAVFEQGRNPLVLARALRRMSRQFGAVWGEQAVRAADGADALIAGGGAVWFAAGVAERCGIPLIGTALQPFAPTRAFLSPLLPPPARPLPHLVNLLSHQVVEWLLWQAFRPFTNAARVAVLKLPALPRSSPTPRLLAAGLQTVHGYSPTVVPPPGDWPPSIHVTGYWFLPPAPDWRPAPDLVRFLEAGPAPIYVGFGSMGERDPRAATRLLLDAVRRSGQRAILAAGWAGLSAASLPEDVHLVQEVPHDWLLPRVAAAVHHGGAGTTAATARAGVPAVIVPFLADQPFWAERMRQLGVALPPVPRARLSAAALAAAMRTAATDHTMRRRAAELRQRLAREDGVGAAVAVIQRVLEG